MVGWRTTEGGLGQRRGSGQMGVDRDGDISPDLVAPPRVPLPSSPQPQVAQPPVASVSPPPATRRGAPLPSVVPVVLRGNGAGQGLTGSVPGARIVDREPHTPAAVRVRGPVGEAVRVAEPPGRPSSWSASVGRARTALGLGPHPLLVPADLHVVVDVDADGIVLGTTQRTLWRALRPGPARVALVEQAPSSGSGRPVVEAIEGCVAGRTYADLREGLFVTALELPGPVSSASTRVTRHRTCLAGGLDARQEVVRTFESPAERVRLEVRFHSDRLPVGATAWVGSDRGEAKVDVPLVDGRLLWSGAASSACTVGLRWGW